MSQPAQPQPAPHPAEPRQPGIWIRRCARAVHEFLASARLAVSNALWRFRDRHHTWHPDWKRWPFYAGLTVAGGVVAAWLAAAVYLLSAAPPASHAPGLGRLEHACQGNGLACASVTGFSFPVLVIVAGYIYFLLFSYRRTLRRYLRQARKNPRPLVPTAGSIFGEVVGRDQLCDNIIHDLRSQDDARPQLIMGGVGSGKTAVLVELTRRLAEKHIVPVAIRLREIQGSEEEELDFEEIGRQKFRRAMQSRLRSAEDEEKTWRRLREDRQVCVLADGLEETLLTSEGGGAAEKREARIREAVRRARKNKLLLVIASRPHDPLRALDAAVTDLEPLSEEEATRYLLRHSPFSHDEYFLARLVNRAGLVEAPIYLQIARELFESGEKIENAKVQAETAISRTTTLALRCTLMKSWMQALEEGRVRADAAIDTETRKAVIEQVSLLALIGLKNDSLVVQLNELATADSRSWPGRRYQEVQDRSGIDASLAVTLGSRLGLVEFYETGVRFPHSVLQAYLGARALRAAAPRRGSGGEESGFLEEALRKRGREFLLALVISIKLDAPDRWPSAVRKKLAHRLSEDLAGERHAPKLTDAAAFLEAYATLFDTVTISAGDHQKKPGADEVRKIADDVAKNWQRLFPKADAAKSDQRTVEEAKKALVRRFGEAAKQALEPTRHNHAGRARELKGQALGILDKVPGRSGLPTRREPYTRLLLVASQEDSYPVRLEAAAQIGLGGEAAANALPTPLQRMPEAGQWYDSMQAVVAPLLVAATTPEKAGERVERYVGRLGTGSPEPLPYSEEVALAQGFKFAANRKRCGKESREFLVRTAEEAMRRTGHWYTHINLLQALTLWALDRDSEDNSSPPQHEPHAGEPRPGVPLTRTVLDSRDLVKRWLREAGAGLAVPDAGGRRAEHPFLTEAGRLAVLALHEGDPQRYLWMDESEVVSRVGSAGTPTSAVQEIQQLWIPPSAGWGVLDPRARRLVADILVLVTLAKRGEESPGSQPRDDEDKLARPDLPPCLSGRRGPLAPALAAGARPWAAGETCAHDCEFRWCPYPPRMPQEHWTEIDETLCRNQYDLLDRHQPLNFRQAAWWQGTTLSDLRAYWAAMEERAQR